MKWIALGIDQTYKSRIYSKINSKTNNNQTLLITIHHNKHVIRLNVTIIVILIEKVLGCRGWKIDD